MFLKPEDVQWQWVTGDSCVMNHAGYLIQIELQSNTAGAGGVTLYDGVDNKGPVIETLRASQYNRCKVKYSVPRPVQTGLYLDVGSNVTGVLVGFTYKQFTDLDQLETTK